ncbi:hypothetical protein [Xylanimonas allomyrinae]|uniref:hypothetical protein n=1 Tax=Xylanimonas allomyrinae TaxID=2509459 RepID=UPI001FED10E4|nr:hypothetical protein [Xylanimonas allomyrinae]
MLTGPAGPLPVPLRHAEILLLLGDHPGGLGADELAVLLHPGDLSDVAVRAEVSRLRRTVGPLLVGSRPYRLARPCAPTSTSCANASRQATPSARSPPTGGPCCRARQHPASSGCAPS